MNFKIKEAREKIGLSQKELANALGIKPSTFNGYEKGIHDPKSEVLMQIAQKCETTVDYLLGLSEKPHKTEIIDCQKKNLIHNYELLNSEGQKRLSDYSADLVSSGNYSNILEKEKHA